MRVVAALLLLAGCDVLWSIDYVTPYDAPPPPDSAGPCSVTDDFSMRLAAEWLTFNGNSNQFVVEARDGALHLDISTASSDDQAIAHYGPKFDLTGGSVEIEALQVVNKGPTVETYMRLRDGTNDDHGYTIRYGDGTIDFRTEMPPPEDNIHLMRPYSPTLHRSWRISSKPATNEITFATREMGSQEWFDEITVPAMWPVDNMSVLFIAGTYSIGLPDAGVAIYDNFAVCGARAL